MGLNAPLTGDSGTAEVSHVVKIPSQSNDTATIGTGDATTGLSLLKGGVYAFNVPWAIRINDPPKERASIQLLTTGLEFSHDINGHVTAIRNGPVAEGNHNPNLELFTYPTIELILFLYDGEKSDATSSDGIVVARDEAGQGFDTYVTESGLDSNSDPYGPSDWDYHLGSGGLGRIWQGALCGAFSLSQSNIDAMYGGMKIGLEFKRGAIESGSSFSWKYNAGSNLIYSPLNPQGTSNILSVTVPPISPPNPPE